MRKVRSSQRQTRALRQAGVLLLAAAAAPGCGATDRSAAGATHASAVAEGGLHVGAPAPELQVEPLQGQGPTTLAEGRGRVVLLDFWALFCKPCKALLSRYQRLVDELGGKLAVIAVNVDDPEDVTPERIRAFADQLGLSFSIVWDRSQRTVARYDPPHLPTSYLIDQRGMLRRIYTDIADLDPVAVRAAVDGLLRQQPRQR